MPYFNPHSVRDTLVQLGQRICVTPEDFKAWSQNLGHEGVMTTFRSYGEVSVGRQGDLIRRLGVEGATGSSSQQELLERIAALVKSVPIALPGGPV